MFQQRGGNGCTAPRQHWTQLYGGRIKKLFALAALAALIPVSALAQAAGQQKNGTTNWTGFYAGLNTGGTFSSSNAQTGTTGGDYFQPASATQINYA
jgi:nitrate/nitrite transporter NarK